MQGTRTLVIEDGFLLAREMSGELRAQGFNVVGVASSVEAALHFARSGPVDIAILGMDLRGQPVHDVLRVLVDLQVRLVFVTGHTLPEIPAWVPPSLHFEKPVAACSVVAALKRNQLPGGTPGQWQVGSSGLVSQLVSRPRTDRAAVAAGGPARRAAVPSAPGLAGAPCRAGSTTPVSVGLGVRDALLREGLRRILADDGFAVAGETDTPAAVLAIRPLPDMLLVEGGQLNASVRTQLDGLRERGACPILVVLAGREDEEAHRLALALGANGVLKDISPGRLTLALRRLAFGRPVLPASVPPGVLQGRSRRRPAPALQLPGLSERERQVAAGLVCGYSNKHIANRLKIAEGTVKSHMKAILRKAHARNRTQGALWAIANGVTEEDIDLRRR